MSPLPAVPPTGPRRIARPQLSERIAAAVDAGALLVIAGAGYGKTTAIDEALQLRGGPVAWVPMTEREREPGRLLVALLQALARAVPGLAEEQLLRLQQGVPVDPMDVERRVLGELDALVVEPVVLVLDDAERLAGASESLSLVGALLRARPGRLRVVVASRRDLGLRVAKASAAGHLHRLGEEDLVFTADEVAELHRAVRGAEPDPAEVERVMAETLGWPLGVTLGVPAGSGSEEALMAFLAEEVLDRLEADERDAVLDSAAVEILTEDLLAPLGLRPDFLRTAPELDLPLQRVPSSPGRYAYHPLVRELLRRRWEEQRPIAHRRALLARVAPVLEAEGRLGEAIAAWLDVGCWDEVVRALAGEGASLLAAAPGTVRDWLAGMPAEVLDAPLGRLLQARLSLADGDPEAAVRALRDAVEALEAASLEVRWSSRFLLAEAMYWAGQLDGIADLADGFDAPEVRELGGIGDAVAMWAAVCEAALGRFESAEALVARVGTSRNAGAWGALRVWHDFYVHAAAGEGGVVLSRYESAMAAARRDPALWRPELVLASVGFLLGDLGRLDEGVAAATAFAEQGRRLARADLEALGHVQRAWLLSLAGRADEAEAALSAPGSVPRTWVFAFVHATQARIEHLRGRPAAAVPAAARAIALLEGTPVAMGPLVVCAVLETIAEARPEQARQILDEALAHLDAHLPGRRGRFYRARLLAQRAWLAARGGAVAEGAADLGAALVAADDTAVDLLRVEWPRLREVVDEVLAADPILSEPLLSALEGALPGELLPLADHRAPAVRRRVAAALGRSGHAGAPARLARLAADSDLDVAEAARLATAAATAAPLPRAFRVLGGFGLRRGEWEVDERTWDRPMAQRLVRMLLVRRGELVPEEELLEAFWPGKPATSARSALHVNISRARAVLDGSAGGPSAIQSAERAYRLVLCPRDSVDADAFERAAQAGLAATGPDRRLLLERALRAWTGDPLPEDRYADWAKPWRDRLTWLHLEVLRAILEAHVAAGDHPAAVEAGARGLEIEPLDESLHRALMTVYARAGHRARALRQYLECRRLLVDELGVEPSQETAELHRRILAGVAV
ncbi:MAG TPA: BTAD domain-containing putative transcriptional regulator [Baekduia sp.]|nr:BTAD domain-containing putative transcriptional regulator [Baekduia sp.]